MTMDILRKFRKNLDITSTPLAPKIGRIPLPELEDGEEDLYIPDHSTSMSDSSSTCCPSSPSMMSNRSATPSPTTLRAPTPRKPFKAFSVSSSWGSPSSSRPASPLVSPPPTPKWKSQLRERETSMSRRMMSPSHSERDSSLHRKTMTPHPESHRRASKPYRLSTPQPPPSSRISERTLSPPSSDAPVKHSRPLKGILKSAPKQISPQPTPQSTPTPSLRQLTPTETQQEHSDQPLPSKVSLHWQLLPWNPAMSKKRIFFDVSSAIVKVLDDSSYPRVPCSEKELKKPAGNVSLTKMTIVCTDIPQWPIVVENFSGISCKDVFETIHETLHVGVSGEEKKKYITEERRKHCEKAFKKRCRDDPGLTLRNEEQGMRRVDLLEGKSVFLGLKRPMDEDSPNWVLELGSRSSSTSSSSSSGSRR